MAEMRSDFQNALNTFKMGADLSEKESTDFKLADLNALQQVITTIQKIRHWIKESFT